ncbi:DUF308 domain-containing protein [Candidatus Saccharibacteria bacterium]|nr:DUF308 domain-containing protein [Candidatus Saccharibacteria bacterium]
MSESENEEKGLIEAEIVKDNDGEQARKKAADKRHFNDFFAPIIVDFILFALGVCLIVWADKVTNAISIAIGSLFILYALYNFIDYYRAKAGEKHIMNLVTGIAMIIAGVFLCVNTGFIKEALSFIVGTFIIIISLMRLQDSLKLKKSSSKYQLPLYMAIIGILAGTLMIIGKIFITDIFMQVIGVFIVIFAISNMTGHISFARAKK